MKSNGIKILVLILTLLNVALLIYGFKTYPDWILVVFCAAIFELLLGILYLQYRVYWANSKNNSTSVPAELKNLKQQVNSVYNRVDALFSIHSIIKLRQPLPIMQDWTITSDYGHALIQEILAKSSGNVLDVGSGISTLLAGYAVEKRGNGNVIALEHEETYFIRNKKMIADHQLTNCVKIYHCPLKKYTINGEEWLWYDISGVPAWENIEVVSIDGPPGNIQKLSRYPALPILNTKICDTAVVLLDDGDRPDEKLIVEKWKQEFSVQTQYHSNAKGLFILQKR